MSDIDDVKSRLDIIDLISKRVMLKKAGRNFKGLCPFHGEKTPSFMVNPDRQAWHCFGCGKGGSVIDFVMEYEHLDFREALEELAEQAGVTLTRRVGQTPEDKQKDTLLEIHHIASEYFHYLLLSHPVGEKAREYIKNRGASEKIIETFGIGYSAQSWDGLTKYLRKKNFADDLLIESGLVIASNRGGYDRFRGRLMFPLRDHRGQVLGFSGRLLDSEVKEAKYINSPETPIYTKGNMVFALDITKGSIQKEQTAIVMEGEFDVLSSYQAGVSNVVAIKGTALTEAQVRLLKRFAPKIIFALDSDIAGDAASFRGIEIAERAGLEIHVATMPIGKDPDDVARHEPGTLKKAIKEAESIYDYYIASSLKRYDITTAYGKKSISDELLPIFAKIENSIVQAHYVGRLSELLRVSETVITTGMKKVVQKDLRGSHSNSETQMVAPSAEDKQELLILSLLLQGNTVELAEDFSQEVDVSSFSSPAIVRIIEQLTAFLQAQPHFFLRDFVDSLPKELESTVDQAFLLDLGNIIDDSELLSRTWQMTLREVKKKRYYARLQELRSKLKETEGGESAEYEAEIAQIASQLRLLEKTSTI